jgi:hypothetical protein
MSNQPASEAELLAHARAFREFVEKFGGTLPEVITEANLPILNEGLRLFFAELRVAAKWFHTGEGDGRGGAVMSVDALWKFIALFDRPLSEGLHMPAQSHFDELTHENPRHLTGVQQVIRGQAAGTVKRLMQAGLSQHEAHKQVAKVLVKHRVSKQRHGQQISANTVRYWCEDVAADVSRKGMAAIAFDRMFTEMDNTFYASLPSDGERRNCALRALSDFLHNVAPNGGRQKTK